MVYDFFVGQYFVRYHKSIIEIGKIISTKRDNIFTKTYTARIIHSVNSSRHNGYEFDILRNSNYHDAMQKITKADIQDLPTFIAGLLI